MKYVYSGLYRQYRGYIFTQGKPVEITDRGTLELIKNEPDFKEVYEEAQGQTPDPTPVLVKTNSKGKECSVCHKLIPRGWYMHQKWCKG